MLTLGPIAIDLVVASVIQTAAFGAIIEQGTKRRMIEGRADST